MTESSDRHWARAQRYLAGGQLTAAQIALASVVQRNPAHTEAHLFLSGIAWQEDRVRDSTRHALDAARQLPAQIDANLLCDVGTALMQSGETLATHTLLEHAVLARTTSVDALSHLSALRSALGEYALALAALDRARSAGAHGAEFAFSRGMHLVFNGRMDEAEAELEACLRMPGAPGRAAQELARLRKQTPERNHLDYLARRLQQVAQGSEDHAALEFARYKELEDLGRYAEAWPALARGNALMYARFEHDPKVATRLFRRLIDICTPDFLQPANVIHPGPQPIFIIGMPRSGTTLLDRLLGNHSQIESAGELDDFALQLRWMTDHAATLDDTVLDRLADIDYAELGQRYLDRTQWRAQGKRYYLDKLPRNWMVAGLIRRALPQARILHLVRAPMDVCFSNFRVMFADAFAHIYEFGALAAHYRQYRDVLAHWHAAMPGQIFDVAYTDLVHDPASTVRDALAFCGLEWEPGCADLAGNRTAVATLSAAQVRGGIHTRAIDEWRRYATQLEPLRRLLEA